MGIVEFFTSADVTLSNKLLEIVYLMTGLIALYAGIANFRDEKNPKRIGSGIFWTLFGVLFIISKWVDPILVGVLMICMVLPAIVEQVGPGSEPAATQEEVNDAYNRIGMKIFIPAFAMGACALIFALFTKISSLVGIGLGVLVGCAILMILDSKLKPKTFLKDSRRMLDLIGAVSLLPTLLAALGAVFTAAGVGTVISNIVQHIVPQGNIVIGIIVYAVGMALFTMIMGNAFAAITVLTVGVGAPFVLSLGADPTVVGVIALTCGYCGTLMTPMAANFNIVPVALLEMHDNNGVIKKQVVVALIMLAVQIVYMIVVATH